jgi:DNA-binding NarL/FixJ family response regulator
MGMIKVLIFEDNPARRDGLSLLLNTMEDMQLVGAYEDCREVERLIAGSEPDVVLMDINMPHVDGIEGLRRIKRTFPEVKVIMLTVFEDEDKILEAISAGADGYLLKQKSPMKLMEGIEEVVNGGAPMTPTVARKVLKFFSTPPKQVSAEEFGLTRRETEILSLLIQGHSYKMIAEKCFVTYATVNKHISNIYKKLQVNSVAAAISRAIKEGLISPRNI